MYNSFMELSCYFLIMVILQTDRTMLLHWMFESTRLPFATAEYEEYLHAVDLVVVSMVTRETTVPLPFRNFPAIKVFILSVWLH